MLIKSASAGAGDAGRLGGSMEVRRGPIALGPIHGAAFLRQLRLRNDCID
jgi:hypothetical protein